jgi:hypothetical protein
VCLAAVVPYRSLYERFYKLPLRTRNFYSYYDPSVLCIHTIYTPQLQELLEDTERREKEVLLKRRALEMLPSARDNIGTWSSVVHAVMRVRRHLLVGSFRCPRAITSAVGIDAWLCSWWWLLWCVCV